MAAQQPEPLKVFLQNRIKTIIAKEWWDFVVNVNNMNSDHASLLYSVANLCPSFQNFLRTRDKELSYILQKRPQVKPRIFSGSERLDIPSVPIMPPEVPKNQKKSCSAELDQILQDLYPEERSIIKRKPRTYGPISKQKRMQNLKKYQTLQANRDLSFEETNSVSLCKVLREGDSCTTVNSSEPSTSNREKQKVEYRISNYDVNRNKLSLNMKKVKKIVKVKKTIMTYTDNNDKSRTKYLLENETPELKRELIRKFRIKRCSVALPRLTYKQIQEAILKSSAPHAPKPSSLVNNVAPGDNIALSPIVPKQKILKAHSDITSPSPSPSPSPNHLPSISPLTYDNSASPKPHPIIASSLPEISISKSDQISNSVIKLIPKIPESDESTIFSKTESNENGISLSEKGSDRNNSSSMNIKLENASLLTVEPNLKPQISQNETNSIKSHNTLSEKSTTKATGSISQALLKYNGSITLIKNETETSKKCDRGGADKQGANPSVNGEQNQRLIIKEELSKPFLHRSDSESETLLSNNPKSVIKKIPDDDDGSICKSPEAVPENQATPLSPKYHNDQKENVAVGEKFRPKELNKDYKNVYSLGGIIPLGKISSSINEKSILEKGKHFLSLKEKKLKETIPDSGESVSPLKEKNLISVLGESRQESILKKDSDTEKIKETQKPVDKLNFSDINVIIKSEAANSLLKDLLNSKVDKSGEKLGGIEKFNEKEMSSSNSENNSNNTTLKLNGIEDNKIEEAVAPGSPKVTIKTEPSPSNVKTHKPTENEFLGNSDGEKDSEDDVIIVEMVPEVIEIMHDDDEDTQPCETETPTIKEKSDVIDCDAENSTKNSKNILRDSNVEDEPLSKRPKVDFIFSKLEHNNRDCKLCHTTFGSYAEWLQHFDNDVPKCAPNIQVSWDQPEQTIH